MKLDYTEAHYNLGNALKELGRLDEAEASYNQAIELKSLTIPTPTIIWVTRRELGRLDEAEASFKQAIELKLELC